MLSIGSRRAATNSMSLASRANKRDKYGRAASRNCSNARPALFVAWTCFTELSRAPSASRQLECAPLAPAQLLGG